MTARVVEVAAEALDEALEAEAWYRDRSDRAAERFVEEIERALRQLAESPEIGPRWLHRGIDARIRRLPLRRFPFVLFYAERGDVVRVLAVAHAAREPGYWARRERK